MFPVESPLRGFPEYRDVEEHVDCTVIGEEVSVSGAINLGLTNAY